jgi:pimeloyl-ACP methyl ester carboxylesterase
MTAAPRQPARENGEAVVGAVGTPSPALRRFTVPRGDVTLSGLAGGEGDLVVLLHGLAGSAAEMVPLGRALGRRFIALDQRGHGFSTRRPSDLSRPAFVDDVLAVIGDEPAWLVGQSMGAHTAMLVAAAREVNGLVMISGGVGGSTDDYPKALGEWFASWPVPFADEAAAIAFLGDKPITRAWLDDFERRPDGLRPRFDADILEAIMRPVADAARWDAWERISAPTLLIRGEQDDADPVEIERMGRRARVETVAGAGHDVHLEKRELTARLIRDFIDGC